MKNKLSILLASAILAACGGDRGGDNAPADSAVTVPNTPAASELAVAVDRNAVRVYSVDTGTPALLATSALPGIPGTYTRSGNTVTVSMPKHGIRDGLQVTLNFSAGAGGTATNGTYQATYVDDDTFTVNDAAAGAISGGALLRDPVTQLAGTFSRSGNTVTITVANHGLTSRDGVNLQFITGGVADFPATVQSVVDANTITVTSPTSGAATGIVNVGVGTNYTSFDVVMHPSGKWLYVTSGYDCSYGSPFCWGGDVITQYAINWSSGQLSAVEAQRTGDSPTSIPVNMAINPAGTRLVNQDDRLDGLRMWTIDAGTGHLAQVANSGSGTSSEHGIVFSADGNYVYHGSSVFQVGTGPDSISLFSAGSGATATHLVNNTLYSIGTGSGISTYSLADPVAPALIANASAVTNRDLTVAKSGSLMVASGPGGIQAYTFDGTTISAATPASGTSAMQSDGTAGLGAAARMYRSAALNDAGNLVVSSYFTTNNRVDFTPSGVFFARVGADGALTHVVDIPGAQYARAARIFKNPAQ